MKKKKAVVLTACFTVLLAVVLWVIWGNSALELNTYTVIAKDIPEFFDGYRIVHISDLHNAQMGDNNQTLLEMIEQADPDMIAITGDLIDSRNTNITIALQFAEKAMQIAPCYYVTGNHEAKISDYDKLKSGLVELGVVVLENTSVEIEREGEKFC